MQLPSAITKQSQIQAAINAVKRSLAPDAVHVRYEIGQDWSGEWSIFFRMVLTDDAAKHRLRDVAAKIVWAWRDSWTSQAWEFSRITLSGAFRSRKPCRNRLGRRCCPLLYSRMHAIWRREAMRGAKILHAPSRVYRVPQRA
jgi:hypothetical protein